MRYVNKQVGYIYKTMTSSRDQYYE